LVRHGGIARIGRARRSPRPAAATPRTLAVDIGGSGIKVILLDAAGKPLTDRARVATPRPATPRAVIAAIAGLAKEQGDFDRVSVGFPGVVRKGVTESAWNLHPTWIGVDLAKTLGKALGRPVRAANDADVQGYGVVAGKGVELVITLGTGFGSALFVDGRLAPNLQLAHHLLRKRRTFEDDLGAKALRKAGKKRWNRRLERAIRDLGSMFNYDALWIGGGNAEKVRLDLPDNVRIVPNIEGLLGGIALWRD
jgi:polyphosphate glucokinase